ncbi:MAG: hypothetical protein EZS28_048120 [Streblomastix strix]|uniref:Uncharacterized protein n=1 Tax=Streblomastix strix TaxID=222440 RepID=A0A5J4TEZ8_9EUKA|nr:MAG: hypothetical protein EZS28_048120 [Streblomastix strix]
MNDWMAVQDNVAKLAINDNPHIINRQVTDNQCEGTNLRILETQLFDMINDVTSLDASTGGSSAIIDISIDGNTLTLAKNTTFVTTGFDQSITGMKTFTSTIISNGIQYSEYNNSSVFLAGGGVRLMSDINTCIGASLIKGEDDALVLTKAEKI